MCSAYRKLHTRRQRGDDFAEHMNHTAPVRTQDRLASRLVVGAVAVVIVAVAGGLGNPAVSSSATSFVDLLRGDDHGGLGEADGVVPDRTTVFDDQTPAVANLDPALLEALRRAARDAAEADVGVEVNSGWRSADYQEHLLREAVAEYGSAAEAARWVATPETSAHVSGDAVDIGPDEATAWLSDYGAHYGLCRIYRNEPWHFELRHEASSRGCPPMYADPTHDPRVRS